MRRLCRAATHAALRFVDCLEKLPVKTKNACAAFGRHTLPSRQRPSEKRKCFSDGLFVFCRITGAVL
ncbi:hypothetical protein [Kingella potus]|uniref:hypothetical protein n=1 Tax=Kingella potus TaxID=265175 RepID=UPI001FD4E965|nr:hypothetical protein [Kingella potus]UOP00473.1 hypothetical protein LVJ84_11455 [Kingella potus]